MPSFQLKLLLLLARSSVQLLVWLHSQGIVRGTLLINTSHRAGLQNLPLTAGDQRDSNIFLLHLFYFFYLIMMFFKVINYFRTHIEKSIFKCFVIKQLSIYWFGNDEKRHQFSVLGML